MINFNEQELALLEANGVSAEEASSVIEMFPQNLDTAIGYIVGLKKGQGQERNEPFQKPEVGEVSSENPQM